MSEVKNIESVYVPPLFPTAGRLPSDPQKVSDNYDLQMAETEKYRQKLNAQRSLYLCWFCDVTNYRTHRARPNKE
ncbi:hypothetical protein [Pseudomonas sp. MWU16-30323]|uniref:hypothetical protein n=1 Tax=Pseudomonas sp. MWU16-30323 TaxID=2878094 RepID=UPI001CFB6FD3|nr:hypothetical protein [Pseudomonas sp. MWU16-30323]